MTLGLCPQCGISERIVRSNGSPLPLCSECWGPNRAEVGTVTTNARGYSKVKQEDGRWRFYHIVVAEQHLGRSLRDDERVRWADGDHSNNDPANLVIETVKRKPLLEVGRPRKRSTKRTPRVQVQLPGPVSRTLAQYAEKNNCTPAQAGRLLIMESLLRYLSRQP